MDGVCPCLQEEPSAAAGRHGTGPCAGGQVFSPEEDRAVGGAIEQLGFRILEQLPVGPQQPNIVLSPLSLTFALAQLALGQSQVLHDKPD